MRSEATVMAGRAKKHLVDGEWMSVAEAAARLGLRPQQLYNQMSNKQCGLQAVVNMVRDGLILGQGRAARYMVDGRWMTIRDAAGMLGVTPMAIHMWLFKRKRPDGSLPPLAEAVAAYRRGEVRNRGKLPKQHRVGGKLMTMREAADMLGVSYAAMQLYVYKHRCSVARAVKYYEAKKKRRAEREILRILGY